MTEVSLVAEQYATLTDLLAAVADGIARIDSVVLRLSQLEMVVWFVFVAVVVWAVVMGWRGRSVRW